MDKEKTKALSNFLSDAIVEVRELVSKIQANSQSKEIAQAIELLTVLELVPNVLIENGEAARSLMNALEDYDDAYNDAAVLIDSLRDAFDSVAA